MPRINLKTNKRFIYLPKSQILTRGFTLPPTFKKRLVKGFTLLEALMAISILMVAVVAPLTIVQKGLSSASYSKNQMIASYLAQDAIEYIKNKRDETFVRNNTTTLGGGGGWDNLDYFDDCKTSGFCQIDTTTDDNNVSAFAENSHLYLSDVTGYYHYYSDDNDSNETIFTRKIQIEMISFAGGDNKALITVTVNWGVNKEVVLKTIIYNI